MTAARCAAVALAVAQLGSLAHADPGRDRAGPVVVEVYREARPVDADRVVARLRRSLEHRGFTADPAAVIARFGDRVPLAGRADPAVTASGLAERAELGYKAAVHGHYAAAVRQLEAVLVAARANPAVVIADPRAARWQSRALVGLAFARSRLGNSTGATDAMAEHLRSLPDQPVTREQYGPEAVQLYATTRDAIAAVRPGRLAVAIAAPGARIYVDEIASPPERELAPGPHRVLAVVDGVARRYAVAVASDRVTRLAPSWELDSRFTASRRWVGFAGLGDRDPLSWISRACPEDAVLAIAIHGDGTRRLVVATLLARGSGAVVRRGSIELGAREETALDALADYVATGVRSPELIPEPPPRPVHRPRSHVRRWPLIAIGAGVIGPGAYLVHVDGRGTCGATSPVQCPRLHRTAAIGWAMIAGGSLLAGFGIYATLTGSVQLVASPAGAAIAWSF